MLFRKKTVIDAVQWFRNGDHPEDFLDKNSVGETEGLVVRYYRNPDHPGENQCRQCGNLNKDHGFIETLEGGLRVCPGDWIITGVKGERYPCKDDIFRESYELVEDTPSPCCSCCNAY